MEGVLFYKKDHPDIAKKWNAPGTKRTVRCLYLYRGIIIIAIYRHIQYSLCLYYKCVISQSSSLVVPNYFTEYEIRLYYTGTELPFDENIILRYMYYAWYILL